MTCRILVVDDDESVAFSTSENLSELGTAYHIEAATSGEEAWQKMSVEPYDLIITDLRMPGGMDGLELLRRTRKSFPQTRLILMTAYGSDEVQASARRLQAYRYITKPFRMEELLDAARDALVSLTVNNGGILIFSDERFEAISRQLDQLRFDTGAPVMLLSDTTGQTIARIGDISYLNLNNLTALVAGGLSTTLEMRRVLGEKRALNLNYHEGDLFDVYSATIGKNLFLLFIFDRRSRASRIGVVWLYAKRAIETLQELTSPEETSAADVLEEGFGDMLLQEMDSMFEGPSSDISLEQATAALSPEADLQDSVAQSDRTF
jgi:CheY-like chemotaxis protein